MKIKLHEAWYKEYPFVLLSQIEALRQMLPEGEQLNGAEIGMGTGEFADTLGIKERVVLYTDQNLQAKDKILIKIGDVEHLPYDDLSLDFIVIASCKNCFNDLHVAFQEIFRVLKKNGVLVIGFMERNSIIGRDYELCPMKNLFYKQVNFFSIEKVIFELSFAGFRSVDFVQTLFDSLELTNSCQQPKSGFGEGSFVVVQAKKLSPE